MARTLAEYIEITRSVLQDQRAPYRYTNLELCRYLSEGVSMARRLRPDLFAYQLDAPLPSYTDADMSLEPPLPEFYFDAVTNYVAGRAEMRDDTFTTDGRAVALMNLYTAALKTGG